MVWYNPLTWIKHRDKRINHDFSDEDRELAKEIQSKKRELKFKEIELQHQIKQREQELKLQELEDELSSFDDDEFEEEEDSADAMLMKFATMIMMKQNQSPQQSSTSTISTPPVSIPRERLMEIFDELPSFAKKMAKKMSDDELRAFIIGKIPNISKETVDEAISVVRE